MVTATNTDRGWFKYKYKLPTYQLVVGTIVPAEPDQFSTRANAESFRWLEINAIVRQEEEDEHGANLSWDDLL